MKAASDISANRTIVSPLPAGSSRPTWSVMIPAYNCGRYLGETLRSVLNQDLGADRMQIEVVDDCSTQDNPATLVEEIGKGRVRFHRQPKNVGHIENFQSCLARSQGHLIHLLHGDDCVVDGFYAKMQQAFEQNPQIGAAFCRHTYINEQSQPHYTSELEQSESGILSNALEKLASRQRIQTPSIVVRREVYEKLGGFDRRLDCVEDWEMWVRIAAHYPIWYEVEPLALYRTHSHSNTGRHVRTGENIYYLRQAIQMMKAYLPAAMVPSITETALEYYAMYALRQAEKLAAKRDFYAAFNHLKEGLRCSCSKPVLRRSLKLCRTIALQQLRAGAKRLNPSS